MARKEIKLPDSIRFQTKSGSEYVLSELEARPKMGLIDAELDMPVRHPNRRLGATAIMSSVECLPAINEPFIATVYREDQNGVPYTLKTTPVNFIAEIYGRDEGNPNTKVIYRGTGPFDRERYYASGMDDCSWRLIPKNDRVAHAMLQQALDGDMEKFNRALDDAMTGQETLF